MIGDGIVLGAWYLFTMLMHVFFGPLHEPHHDGEAGRRSRRPRAGDDSARGDPVLAVGSIPAAGARRDARATSASWRGSRDQARHAAHRSDRRLRAFVDSTVYYDPSRDCDAADRVFALVVPEAILVAAACVLVPRRDGSRQPQSLGRRGARRARRLRSPRMVAQPGIDDRISIRPSARSGPTDLTIFIRMGIARLPRSSWCCSTWNEVPDGWPPSITPAC